LDEKSRAHHCPAPSGPTKFSSLRKPLSATTKAIIITLTFVCDDEGYYIPKLSGWLSGALLQVIYQLSLREIAAIIQSNESEHTARARF
jgi:hypothetical protein